MADEIKAYDEDEAVKFIRSFIPEEIKDKYTDDEILFIIDTIWDYYESKGLTTLPGAEEENEEEVDIDDITKYVAKEIKKDGKLIMDTADIKLIIQGELAYEETLDIFGD
ncbi:MAG: hypothetical protein NC402_07310 [Prevotella sp.]|nr:hypothetical protein [Prevotella sp.]MCM1075553.1 hypothetical protein [Ruminococcus sp.]